MRDAQISYCGQLVREQDADRFLLSMFTPADVRDDVWALFAFNHEIAKTREIVTETQLGLIRLQWWRETIEGIYKGEVRKHEVVEPLAAAIARHDLPRGLFDTLIYAREFDLEDVLPANMEGVLHYADFTGTPLMKLAVQVCGGDAEGEPVQVIASNYALVGILRSVVFFAKNRRCLLPEDMMKAERVSVNQLYELKRQEGLQKVIEQVAAQFVSGVRADHKFLNASQRLAEIYMKQIKRCGYDVFDQRMARPPAFKALRLVLGLS